jgi:predicted nucleic acid-binding protein
LDYHGVNLVDVVLSKLSVKVIDSSVVVKLYETEDGTTAGSDDLADWHAGVKDLFLGCYKHDIQKVERANVDLGMYGEMD